MKIAIDIREAANPRTGKAVYTYEVLRHMLACDEKNEYVLYTRPLPADHPIHTFARGNVVIRSISTPSILWHYTVMKDALKEKVDVFFSPTSYIISSIMPQRVRTVVTVHDLIAFLFPNSHQWKATLIEKLCARRAVKKASAILVPSKNTKEDLKKIFHCPGNKIHVTPLGVSVPDDVAGGADRKDIILTVGGFEPRKNIARLIDAFEKIAKKFPTYVLVIIGALHWKSEEAINKISSSKLENRIVHLQNITHSELDEYYRQARVFVFPSLYEGFGLPPLEAMARGCPVIASNSASLPEVCGDAALYFDPKNTEEMAKTMRTVLSSEHIQLDLSHRGVVRARQFTWQITAEETLRVIINNQ